MTDHPAKPGPGTEGQSLGHPATFNAAAANSCEVELKFLVPRPENGGIDQQVFENVRNFFQQAGWIKLSAESKLLLTRQLDTPDNDLLEKGVTIRIRSDCENGDLRLAKTPDICVKMGKTTDESGAVHRGEFEARIKNFEHIDLAPLLDKYPQVDHPEFHAALDGIKPSNLREFFRIDCIRSRHIVEIPEEITGLTGKRCVVEMILDNVAFVLDPQPGKRQPLVFHHDLEVEVEAMFKPCAYDNHPDAGNYVSSPMSPYELSKLMSVVKQKMMEASGHILTINHQSKAERGFSNLGETLGMLQSYIEANPHIPRKGRIQSAFTLSAEPNLHRHLPQDLRDVLRERPIACYPFYSVK